jgi:hypothetical protein
VDLAIPTLDKAVADSPAAHKPLLFMRTALTDGIERSDELQARMRAGTNAVSCSRRR